MRKRNLKFWGPLFLIATLVAAAADCKEKTPAEVFEEVLAEELARADKVFVGANLPKVPFAEKLASNKPTFRVLITPDRIYFDNTSWLAALPTRSRQDIALRAIHDLDEETPIFSGWVTIIDSSDINQWWQNTEINRIKKVARIREQLTGQDWNDSQANL